jgi:hypothetical protein
VISRQLLALDDPPSEVQDTIHESLSSGGWGWQVVTLIRQSHNQLIIAASMVSSLSSSFKTHE